MTDFTRICIISTAETALKKLKKAEIGVYDCKRRGASFIFSVKDKHVKKAFAIFSNPCYNIRVERDGARRRIKKALLNRIGLLTGAALFIAVAAASNSFIFKISVSGNGSYLSPEIRRIVCEAGVKEFAPYRGFDRPAATGKILALPSVTFCNIEKRGSVLKVDVRVDERQSASLRRAALTADVNGTVKSIVAICGTPLCSVGDTVKKGDTLIAPYTAAGEKRVDCLAAGYAELECRGGAEIFAESECEESLKAAYSAALLTAEEILTRSHTVKKTDGGVIYVIDFTYLHKVSINTE